MALETQTNYSLALKVSASGFNLEKRQVLKEHHGLTNNMKVRWASHCIVIKHLQQQCAVK